MKRTREQQRPRRLPELADAGEADAGTATPTPTEAAGTGSESGVVGDSVGNETNTEFASVSAGGEHTCGVRVDGSVACWGGDRFGQSTPPEGEFASVSAGQNHTCGLRVDGSAACWGYDLDGQSTPAEGEFASVSSGVEHTCGLRVDGSAACWGFGLCHGHDPGVGVRLRQRGVEPHLRVDCGRLRRLLGFGFLGPVHASVGGNSPPSAQGRPTPAV